MSFEILQKQLKDKVDEIVEKNRTIIALQDKVLELEEKIAQHIARGMETVKMGGEKNAPTIQGKKR